VDEDEVSVENVRFTIPPEAKKLISRSEVDKGREFEEKLAKFKLMRKQAIALIPKRAYDNHPLTKKLNKIYDSLMNQQQKEFAPLRDVINKRVEKVMADLPKERQNRNEENRLYKLAFSPFEVMRRELEDNVSIPPITRENLDTYNPKV
jgi:hypothetical protein